MEARRLIGCGHFTTILALTLALGAAACASTKLTSVYRSPDYQGGPFGSLLVIGLSPSEGTRQVFERRFAERLRARGVEALPSAKVLPAHGDLAREQVQAWVRERGIEGVILTHVVDVERETEVVPPRVQPSLYGYYGSRWGAMRGAGITISPGYSRQNTVLRIETNLYDARSGMLVWSASSRTFNPSDRDEVIEELTALVTENLAERGLLPAAG
jgi:hypothetical protein